MKKPPLPPDIQRQVNLFLADYPPKVAKAIVMRYLKLITSEEYRSSSTTKLEEKTIARSRPKPRIRVNVKANEPKTNQKTNQKSTGKSSCTRKIDK
jgi:hypothetical protein